MRISGQTNIRKAGGIPDGVTARLGELWVESVEEYVALCSAADRGLVAKFIEADDDALAQSVEGVSSRLEVDRRSSLLVPRPGGALGCRVDPVLFQQYLPTAVRVPAQAPANTDPFNRGSFPRSVRLFDGIPEVRNQGERGTCVAFATVALREYLAGGRNRFSEQFLYWACKELDHIPEPGTFISTAMNALGLYGVCGQETWPYSLAQAGASEGQGPAPGRAVDEARNYRVANTRPVQPSLVDNYKYVLCGGDGGRGMPVVVAVIVFNSWFMSPESHRTGKITMPLPGEMPLPIGHALTVVGYVDDESVPGGGYFILRNSWGREWGADSPERPGHAVVPYAYIANFAIEAFTGPSKGLSALAAPADGWSQEFVRVLSEDERDIDRRLLRAGTAVIANPRWPGLMREDTPANRAEFERKDRTWTAETRARVWSPLPAEWPERFRNDFESAEAARLAFTAAIDANLKTSVKTAFPDINVPTSAVLLPWQPNIRGIELEADITAEMIAPLLRVAGVPPDVAVTDEFAASFLAVNSVHIYRVHSIPADARVVVAFVSPVQLSAGGAPALVQPSPQAIQLVFEAVARHVPGGAVRKPVFTFYTVGSGMPWLDSQKGISAGDHCLICSHRSASGEWVSLTPPQFATRVSLRNFLERLHPVTRQERISKVKTVVDQLLADGYQANITVAKIAAQTGYRQTTVRDAFVTMQDVSPDKYRVERMGRREIRIRQARRNEPMGSAVSVRGSSLRRQVFLLSAAGVSVGVGVLRDTLKLPGVSGFLVLVFLVYVAGLVQAQINRRASEEKEP